MSTPRSPRSRTSRLMIASVIASSALSPMALAGINTSTDLTATLSNTNFIQTDADALQDRLDAITAEVSTLQQELTETPRSRSRYTALVAELAQLNATATALQTIIVKLREGAEITRYDVTTAANGTATVVVTYDDGTTTTATIPAPPSDTDDEDSDDTDDEDEDSSSGSSGGSGGSASDMLSSILGQLLSGGQNGGLNGGLDGLLGGLTGTTPGATPGTPSVPNPQPTTQPTPEDAKETEEAPTCKPRGTTETLPGKAADDAANGKTTPADSGTTDTEIGKAADDDISANGSTEAYKKEQEEKQKALDKLPYCEPPQVETPNPQGKNGSEINSLSDAQQYVGKYIYDDKSSAKNRTQCASLTKALTDLGRTPTWYKGEQVYGNDLAIGTPIATFCNGNNYGSGISGCSHTGIYLGQSAAGIKILHQWNGSGGARIDTIPWDGWGKRGNEGGMKYYAILNGNNASLGIAWYLPSLLTGYDIPLQGEGLAISFTLSYTQLQPHGS